MQENCIPEDKENNNQFQTILWKNRIYLSFWYMYFPAEKYKHDHSYTPHFDSLLFFLP